MSTERIEIDIILDVLTIQYIYLFFIDICFVISTTNPSLT